MQMVLWIYRNGTSAELCETVKTYRYLGKSPNTNQLEHPVNGSLGYIRPSGNVKEAPLSGRIDKLGGAFRAVVDERDDGYVCGGWHCGLLWLGSLRCCRRDSRC